MITMGASISRADATGDPGVAGCLVQFPDEPEKLLMVTANHVLIATTAQQFDPVAARDLPGQTLGVLLGWTALGEEPTTTDAALVQVDPALVSAALGPLGAPNGTNLDPQLGARLRIFAAGQVRSGAIREIGVDRTIEVVGPDFRISMVYRNQILCDEFSVDGCSGAIALDDDNKVVGMVVAGDGATFTLVTPIDAVLSNPHFGEGPPLDVLATVPATAKTFTVPVRTVLPVNPRTGTSLAQQAMTFFENSGWSKAQALGLVANIEAESHFNPHGKPGDGGISFGICQWNGSRLDNFESRFGPIQQSTYEQQLQFVNIELHDPHQEGRAGDKLRLQTNAADAARVVCIDYERPDNKFENAEERARRAGELAAILT